MPIPNLGGVDLRRKSSIFILLLILSPVIAGFLGAPLGNAAVYNHYDWPTLQANSQRTSYTESPGPKDNQTNWIFKTGGPIVTSPVAVGGMIIFSCTDGYLYSVNATTGEKIWSTWIGANVSSPSVALGKVFLTSASGTAFAFDANTGSQVWSKSFSDKSDSDSPLILGSRVFVSGNQTICALNEAVGVWLSEKDFYHVSEITHLIYTEGMLIAVGLINSSLIRLIGFGPIGASSSFGISVIPSGNNTYNEFLAERKATFFVSTSTSNNNSAMFGFTDMGLHLWERQLIGSIDAFPATAYNTVYAVTSNFVYALNSSDGSVQWSFPIDGTPSASSPAVADDIIYFGLDDGYVYALDAFNGTLIWSYKTGGCIQSSPAISDGLLFVGSNDGNLYSIGYPQIQNFELGEWNNTAYQVNVKSSAYVTNVDFNQQLAQLSFNVVNQSAQEHYWNITFKSDFLKAPYSVMTDDSQFREFEVQQNGSDTILYFNSYGNINQIKITGSEAIPEFPSIVTLLLAPLILVAGAISYKYKIQRKKEVK